MNVLWEPYQWHYSMPHLPYHGTQHQRMEAKVQTHSAMPIFVLVHYVEQAISTLNKTDSSTNSQAQFPEIQTMVSRISYHTLTQVQLFIK